MANRQDEEILHRIVNAIQEGRQPTADELAFALEAIKNCGIPMEQLLASAQEKITQLGEEAGIDTTNFMARSRISGTVLFDVWASLLAQVLQWDISGVDLNPDYLSPFAYVTDRTGDLYALYATSLAYEPGDQDDDMANHLLAQINDMEKMAVLFFKKPLLKEIDGHLYGYYGKVLKDGAWSDFLLTQDRLGFDVVIEQIGKCITSPSPELADKGSRLANTFSVYLDGYDPNVQKLDLYKLANEESGWYTVVFEDKS